jgi:hypothetical protein
MDRTPATQGPAEEELDEDHKAPVPVIDEDTSELTNETQPENQDPNDALRSDSVAP